MTTTKGVRWALLIVAAVSLPGTAGAQTAPRPGELRGREMRIDVTYDGGRAEGRAVVPGPDGMREVAV